VSTADDNYNLTERTTGEIFCVFVSLKLAEKIHSSDIKARTWLVTEIKGIVNIVINEIRVLKMIVYYKVMWSTTSRIKISTQCITGTWYEWR